MGVRRNNCACLEMPGGLRTPVFDGNIINHLCIFKKMYMFIDVSIYLSMYLCLYVSIFLCIYVSMHLSFYVSMYLCIYLCIYLSIYLSTYLPTYLSIAYICLNSKALLWQLSET